MTPPTPPTKTPPPSDIVRFGGGFILVCIGLVVFFGIAMAIGECRQHARMRSWPSTTATVTQSVVDGVRGSDSRAEGASAYEPRLAFAFELDGTSVKADNRRYTDPMTRGEAREIVSQYPVGAEVTVYYDPDDPADVILDNDLPVLSGYAAGYLVTALVLGGYFLGWLLPAMRRKRRAARQSA